MILLQAAPELRPLKPPLDVTAAAGGPPTWVLLAIVVLVLVAAVLTAYLVRRLRARADPALVAEGELQRLLDARLPEQGRLKEHYERLAACLRRYVASAYRLPATAFTPPELTAALDGQVEDSGLVDYLRRVLVVGDMVRFDHTTRTPDEARADVLAGIDVIRAATPTLPSPNSGGGGPGDRALFSTSPPGDREPASAAGPAQKPLPQSWGRGPGRVEEPLPQDWGRGWGGGR